MSALRNFRIVELSEDVAGEYCGKLLADFGAEVIKVERPVTGSPTRQLGPFKGDGDDPERSVLFAYLNTNKSSVVVDLSSKAGVDALAGLLSHADAVIDDHAPGWLAGVGLDPEVLPASHPDLVVCAVTPFGQSAPPDRRHAEPLTIMHSSGWGYHTPSASDPERPPLQGPGRFLANYEAGMEAAMCVCACLYGREKSGKGRFIDISAQEVMASRVDYVLGQLVAGDMEVGTDRTIFDLGGPSGIFPCGSGFVYIWMSSREHWEALRSLLEDPEWMREIPVNWLERGVSPERLAVCRAHTAAWLKDRNKEATAAAAQALGLTMVPVNGPSDLVRSEQLLHRGFFAEVDHPALGKAAYPTVPYKLSRTPARIERPAPPLGHDRSAF